MEKYIKRHSAILSCKTESRQQAQASEELFLVMFSWTEIHTQAVLVQFLKTDQIFCFCSWFQQVKLLPNPPEKFRLSTLFYSKSLYCLNLLNNEGFLRLTWIAYVLMCS